VLGASTSSTLTNEFIRQTTCTRNFQNLLPRRARGILSVAATHTCVAALCEVCGPYRQLVTVMVALTGQEQRH